ncbi:hypothetical protein K466DRAFT_103212 [Polyporus arcularius HHB13444]|uniref:Arrestin-like N-terminal domain-containing protein n=1 Tax=Polyporus arcularius HHB13444 TaxID=1314778 RepID=A0A5C3PGD8_9APHY|nr:hypothetical protein K466DRAFT_103212 [Polyporus arcularius HHB13444]
MSSSSPAIEVVLPPVTYSTGSYVEGEVHLNFRNLQQDKFENIWVTLKGRVQAYVDEEERKSITLVDFGRVLWTHGAEYPPPDSDVLRLFFRFRLPNDIPPSYYHHTIRSGGTCAVLYSLTTVGVRPGWSGIRKIHNPLVVLPRVDLGPLRALSSAELQWRTVHEEKKVWKGLRGNEGSVRVELSIPDIAMLPLFTLIPYKIEVTTNTAPATRRSNGDPGNTQIFPSPPTNAAAMILELVRRTNVSVERRDTTLKSTAAYFLGPGVRAPEPVIVDVAEKEWVVTQAADARTKTKEKGVWVQSTQFSSRFVLDVPPTFSLGDPGRLKVECEYRLKLCVPFEGLGNDVKVEMPVTVVSGVDISIRHKRHRPIQREWDPPEALSLRSRSPQGATAIMSEREVVLSPEYWEVHTDAEWREFGKSIQAPGTTTVTPA